MADLNEERILLDEKIDADVNYQTLASTSTTCVDLTDLDTKEEVDNSYLNSALSEGGDDEDIEDADLQQGQVCTEPDIAPSVLEEHNQGRVPSEDELLFRLRFAHLSPGIDWFDEIAATGRVNNDMGVYQHILGTLREYPLTICEKKRLCETIRARLKVSSMASLSSHLTVNKNELQPRKKSKFMYHQRWKSGLSVPFGIWESSIGRIAAYFGSHVASYFQFLRFLALMNAGIGLLLFVFVALPQIVPGEVWSDDIKSGFFGELSHTIFFYGAYLDTNTHIDAINLSYDRPLAYLMTWSVGNVMAILVIVFSMYISYRRIKKSDDGGDDPFSSHTFLGWDHSVTSREGSKIRSIAITTQIKEMLREEKVKKHLIFQERMKLWCVRLTCNLLSLAVLAATAYLIYYVAEESIHPGLNVPQIVGDFLEEYLLALFVTGLKVVIPPILSLLLLLERYHPRTQIKIQIARTAVFYVASLVVFLASVYSVSTQCLTSSATNLTEYCCWENEVGEKLFQVVILDMAITLIVGLCFTGGRAVLVKLCKYRKFGYQSFNVADLILDLVYGQSLIWLGLFFAPFLAIIGFVKQWILFYFHYALARTSYVPSDKVFRASRSGTFYLFMLLVTLFVCLVPMTYAIIQLEPSTSCGPFKRNMHVYEVLTEKIGESPEWLQDIFTYASTPGLVVPVLIVMLLIILYYRAKSSAHKMEAKDLRYVLQFERKVEKRRVFARAKLEHGISVMSGLER